MSPLVIYVPKITERIAFVMDVVFTEHLHVDYQLTDSITSFEQANSVKISYASQPIGTEVFFWQHPLMTEIGIKPQTIDFLDYAGEPAFFLSSTPQSLFPFDIFSLVFYLITRYEEYLPYKKDHLQRFPASESLAFKSGFLQKPLVDIHILKLAEKLNAIFPEFSYQTGTFRYIATYDIDNAYAFINKKLIQKIGGLCKKILKFDFENARYRIAVLTGKRPDPCDTYDYMDELRRQFNFPSYYFILCASRGKYDVGLSPKNKNLAALIRNLKYQGIIGIHPSVASAFNRKKLPDEIETLSKLANEPITCCRSHFLMLSFPETYRAFLNAGLTDDFTLGYSDQVGFRASTCKSFLFFDLIANQKTALRLHPLAYMEGTLRDSMKLSPKEALPIVFQLLKYVKLVNGEFISLWHNDTFGYPKCEKWRLLYEETLRESL